MPLYCGMRKLLVLAFVLCGFGLAQEIPATVLPIEPEVSLPMNTYFYPEEVCDEQFKNLTQGQPAVDYACVATKTDAALTVSLLKSEMEVAGYELIDEAPLNDNSLFQRFKSQDGTLITFAYVFLEGRTYLIAVKN